MSSEPPVPPPDDKQQQEGYGSMTTAWLDAGAQVADYEAGRNAERRRIIFAVVAVAVVIAVVVAAVIFLA